RRRTGAPGGVTTRYLRLLRRMRRPPGRHGGAPRAGRYNAAMASSPFPLSALKPLAGRALELALNRALALDDDTGQALSRLDGRRVALHLAAPPLAMSIRVDGDALRVGPADDAA